MYSLILHGRRLFELQKWRLSVSVKLFQNASSFSNLFPSASAAVASPQVGRKGKTFTVSYLVDSLGFTTKLAESISRKVSFEEKGNPDSVLNLFKSYRFTDSQISAIISDYPQLLIADAEKSLGPKLQFMQSIGASTSEFTEIISTVPKILRMRWGDKTISRYYDIVKEMIEADKISKLSLSLQAEGSPQENKIRNISVLRVLGVSQKNLFPLLISKFQPVCGKVKFEESLKKVVAMGFDPKDSKFVQALHIVYGLSDKTIEGKINVYKKLGFAVGEVWAIFKKWPYSLKFSEKKISQTFETLKRCGLNENEALQVLKKYPKFIRNSEQKIFNSIETFLGLGFTRDEFLMILKCHPVCIGYSEDTVKKKTEFLVKKMNWSLKAVASNPTVLGYSLEKRTLPRCNVIKTLMSKGFLGSKLPPPMAHVLVCTDETFLERYVRKHDDAKELVAELMSILFTKDRVSR